MKKAAKKIQAYYFTAVFSVIIAVVGFSYNTWRLEVTEDNSNIRTAYFEFLSMLSELEQNIYSLHYDGNEIEGSPRIGWVKVGLIVDLSGLISNDAQVRAERLKNTWAATWEMLDTDRDSVNQLVNDIDSVREEIKIQLAQLQ